MVILLYHQFLVLGMNLLLLITSTWLPSSISQKVIFLLQNTSFRKCMCYSITCIRWTPCTRSLLLGCTLSVSLIFSLWLELYQWIMSRSNWKNQEAVELFIGPEPVLGTSWSSDMSFILFWVEKKGRQYLQNILVLRNSEHLYLAFGA